jgi:hypothetical protein
VVSTNRTTGPAGIGRPSALSQEELEVWISKDCLWMETIGSNYAQGMAQFQQIKSGIAV